MVRNGIVLAALPALAAFLLASAACGGNKSNGNANANTAQGTQPAGSTAAPAGPVTVAQVAPAPSAGAEQVTLTATDNKYSQTKLTAKAGQQVALTLDNKGQATHNWHLLNVKDTSGNDLKLPLLDPGKSQTLVFLLMQPGTYQFWCDVHTSDMKGTLTITP
jgi:plastocyanin